MDAATAAAMSDPERNPYFRRHWNETAVDGSAVHVTRPRASIGTFGLALQEALRLAHEPTAAVRPVQPPEGPTDG